MCSQLPQLVNLKNRVVKASSYGENINGDNIQVELDSLISDKCVIIQGLQIDPCYCWYSTWS